MPGRLICVFGCGGDRDRTKRPIMGETAARLSDLVIVTSDNPRTESPEAIIADILAGIGREMTRKYRPEELESGVAEPGFVVEPDRAAAIALGIRAARTGDTVLIAGKGHEPYQILADRVIPFDDRKQAAAALAHRNAWCVCPKGDGG
jgi:UDP-N-acetylmuramoyl-L-alanyl-D-glutamate--2,6-diaminopimelate ligase